MLVGCVPPDDETLVIFIYHSIGLDIRYQVWVCLICPSVVGSFCVTTISESFPLCKSCFYDHHHYNHGKKRRRPFQNICPLQSCAKRALEGVWESGERTCGPYCNTYPTCRVGVVSCRRVSRIGEYEIESVAGSPRLALSLARASVACLLVHMEYGEMGSPWGQGVIPFAWACGL